MAHKFLTDVGVDGRLWLVGSADYASPTIENAIQTMNNQSSLMLACIQKYKWNTMGRQW